MMATQETKAQGAMNIGKSLATGAPAALVTELALAQYPSMTASQKEAARLGVGALVSAAMLFAGMPSAWSAGPVVGNASVALVGVSRAQGWADKIRSQVQQATGEAPRGAAGVYRR